MLYIYIFHIISTYESWEDKHTVNNRQELVQGSAGMVDLWPKLSRVSDRKTQWWVWLTPVTKIICRLIGAWFGMNRIMRIPTSVLTCGLYILFGFFIAQQPQRWWTSHRETPSVNISGDKEEAALSLMMKAWKFHWIMWDYWLKLLQTYPDYRVRKLSQVLIEVTGWMEDIIATIFEKYN